MLCYLVMISAMFLGSCSAAQYFQSDSNIDDIETIVLQRLDNRAAGAGLGGFRTIVVEGDDFEMRFWVDGGFVAPRGIVITNKRGKLTALYLPPSSNEKPTPENVDKTSFANKWPTLVTDLRREGIDIAPTKDELRKQTLYNDANTVYVQFLDSRHRSEFGVIEPCGQDVESGKRMCRILNLFKKAFAVQL